MQVSPIFMEKIKDIRRKIVAKGTEISLRDLTEKIAKSIAINDMENELLSQQETEMKIIKMDRRWKW
jgi:hypothetical protein